MKVFILSLLIIGSALFFFAYAHKEALRASAEVGQLESGRR